MGMLARQRGVCSPSAGALHTVSDAGLPAPAACASTIKPPGLQAAASTGAPPGPCRPAAPTGKKRGGSESHGPSVHTTPPLRSSKRSRPAPARCESPLAPSTATSLSGSSGGGGGGGAGALKNEELSEVARESASSSESDESSSAGPVAIAVIAPAGGRKSRQDKSRHLHRLPSSRSRSR